MTIQLPAGSSFTSRYLLKEKLGEGGMGTVYHAYDRLENRHVALKRVLTPVEDLTFNTRVGGDDANLRWMLIKEFQMLASLRHPNIISVLDYGFDEGQQPYFTMDYIADAKTILSDGRGRPLAEQIELLVQLLRALSYLHRRGIIHRDVKPANVLVEIDQVKVLDFGLSHMADQAVHMGGTLTYMAPEVLAGEAPTPVSDLYAVGVIMFELISGRELFEAKDIDKLVEMITHQPPDLDSLSLEAPLKLILAGLLSKTPTTRYAEANEVIRELQLAIGQQPMLETRASRESYLSAAKFVGREAEMEQLGAALDAAMGTGELQRKGSAWLVGGESGVGKSRLLSELRIQALVRGVIVLWGQAVKGAGMPYHPWREAIRQLVLSTEISDLEANILKQIVPDIDILLERPIPPVAGIAEIMGRQHLIMTIVDLFKRHQAPILLVFEDLQWFYESLEPLRWLVEALDEVPIMIVASFRTDEAVDLLDSLPAMRLLMLGRLSQADMETLTASMLGGAGFQPGLLDLIEQETEGNAFFIIEVVRALAESVGSLTGIASAALPQHVFSGGLQSIISRRLEHVPVDAQPLLRLAAVAGRWIDLELMRQLKADLDLDEWLSACISAAVVELYEGRYRFAHDKLRNTILLAVPGADIPILHHTLAEAIELVYPQDHAFAALLADRWHTAGEAGKEMQAARNAGSYAYALNEYYRAEHYFLRAHQLAETAPDRLASLKLLGDVHEKLGNYGDAVEYYEDCLALSYTIQPTNEVDQLVGDALNGLGGVALKQARFAAAEGYISRAYQIQRDANNLAGEAYSLLNLGIAAYQQGQHKLAKHQITRSLELFRDIDQLLGAALCLHHLGEVSYLGRDYYGAQEYFRQSLTLRRSIHDRLGIASSLSRLGHVAQAAEDYYTALQYFVESETTQFDIADRWGLAATKLSLAQILQALGEPYEALSYFLDCLALRRSIGDKLGYVHVLVELAALLFTLNDPANARQHLTEACKNIRFSEYAPLHWKVVLGGAFAQLDAGAPTVAASWLGMVQCSPEALLAETHLIQRLNMLLEAQLLPIELSAMLERGKALELTSVLQEIEASMA